MAIVVRPVTTVAECKLIEEITCAAWEGDISIAIPDHMTITVARENGGVVLLAWDGETAVGFCLGFLSYVGEKKQLKHHSHLAGVLPSYRGHHVGETIKWAQRAAVLAQDIDHMTWTYDPLETRNGNLNLHKLGAVCTTYKRDVYGFINDGLNQGSPTDRFYVDWWLASNWVKEHAAKQYQSRRKDEWLAVGAAIVNPPQQQESGWLPGTFAETDTKYVLVAVPSDYQAVKRAYPEAGLSWRLHTREIFEWAFGAGYTAIDLLVEKELCYYLLVKNWVIE
jgi:predicted GNAT superfamily acetyltransferase